MGLKKIEYSQLKISLPMNKKVKVIFLGDTGVGKSSLISAINNEPITSTHQPTIGVDFSIKILRGEQTNYRLQLWDTAGQERFRSIMPSYIRKSLLALIVYDVTDPRTFVNLDRWVHLFQEHAEKGSKVIVIGNKIDLPVDEVFSENIQGVHQYHKISAKSGLGIGELLDIMSATLDSMDITTPNDDPGQNMLVKQNVKNTMCCGLPIQKTSDPESKIPIEQRINEDIRNRLQEELARGKVNTEKKEEKTPSEPKDQMVSEKTI